MAGASHSSTWHGLESNALNMADVMNSAIVILHRKKCFPMSIALEALRVNFRFCVSSSVVERRVLCIHKTMLTKSSIISLFRVGSIIGRQQ